MSKWILRDDSPVAEKNIPMLHLEEQLNTPDQSAANPQNFTEQEVEFNRLQAHSPLPGATGSSLMLWRQQTHGPKGPEPALGHWILHIACALTAPFQVQDTQHCRHPSSSSGGPSPASPELSHQTLGHNQAGDMTATEEASRPGLTHQMSLSRVQVCSHPLLDQVWDENWPRSASQLCWVPGSLRSPGSAWKESSQS